MNENQKGIREKLTSGEPVVSYTVGRSMLPVIRQGRDFVIIRPSLPDGFAPGDVVLFPGSDGRFVLHRLISVDGERCVTRGDNCRFCEYPATKDILGVLTDICRKKDGRLTKVDGRFFKAYSAAWETTWPLRRTWFDFRRLASAIKHKLFK